MAFCTKCGADVSGKSFCVACGTAVSGAQPSAAVAAAPPAPPAPSAPLPPPKKVSPIIWILVGVVGFFVLIGVVIMSAGLFFVHKVTQDPVQTMAKLLTAANPDVEVVSTDSGNNTVTLRDKKTGETVTMNFDDVKKGKIVFKANGKEATIQAHGDGDKGTLEINGPDGSVRFGAGGAAKVPDWVPSYPGATPEVTFSMQANEADGGTFSFTTKDAPKQVLSFYEQGFKQAGYKITASLTGDVATSTGGMISAELESAKRTVMVTVGADKGDTSVNVVFGTKK
jgi:hypothetical protein